MATLLFAAGLSGCFSPSLYQAPRTVAPGEFAGALGVEPSGLIKYDKTSRAPSVSPARWPSLVLVGRYGLTDRIELSASVLLITSASGAAMAKFHVLRSQYFDIALMPRISAGWFKKFTEPYGGCGGEYCDETFHIESSAIALLGLNLGRDVTLVAAPGIVQSLAPERTRGFRLSLGVQIRVSKELAIHPEVTYMPEPLGLSSTTLAAGLAALQSLLAATTTATPTTGPARARAKPIRCMPHAMNRCSRECAQSALASNTRKHEFVWHYFFIVITESPN